MRRRCVGFLEKLFGNSSTAECVTLTCLAKVLPVGGLGARSTLGGFRRFAVVSPKKFTRCVNFARSRIGGLYRGSKHSFRLIGG